MRKASIYLLAMLIFGLLALTVSAQTEGAIVKKDLSQAEINRIVKNFTTKEGEFRESLKDYVFNRSAVIQTIGLGGNVTGEYRRDSFMTLSPEGVRFEKILYAPVPTLAEAGLNFTPQDLEDLGGVNPFALDPSVANLYNFNYLGKQKIDELNLYVFDVSPKIIPDPKKTKERFFTGRIWVDDRDLQIVKSKGKAIPEDKNNKYPVVETWRENIEGKYWFPAYSSSDDTLVFDDGQVVKIRMRVTYRNYKQGRSEVRVLDDDTSATPVPTPTPKKP